MEYIYHYFRLLRLEAMDMAEHMTVEIAGFLAVLTIASGWICLRGHKIQR